MTGKPYAAYARVRAVNGSNQVSPWSTPYGFNLRWKDVPQQLPGYPGLSRWTPVEGATGYEVWFTNIGGFEKHVTMRTNAVDHREAYAFHDTPAWTSTIKWRVRAIRNGEASCTSTASRRLLRPVEPELHLDQPAAVRAAPGRRRRHERRHEQARRGARPRADPRPRLQRPRGAEHLLRSNFGLYRIYVASDSDCVNVIFKGAITGGPAYAPRTSGPLKLPDRSEGGAADGR